MSKFLLRFLIAISLASAANQESLGQGRQTDRSGARAIAVCVGINHVDEEHYGSALRLKGCHNDALFMTELARTQGFSRVTTLLSEEAISESVLDEIAAAADELQEGDLFMFTIASHGGQMEDENGDEQIIDIEDELDETWLCFDRQLLDDEFYQAIADFEPGVRILVVADTCHSGTSIRAARFAGVAEGDSQEVLLTSADLARQFRAVRERDDLLSASVRSADGQVEVRGGKREDRSFANIRSRTVEQEFDIRAPDPFTLLDVYERNFNGVYRDVFDQVREFRGEGELKSRAILLAACTDSQTAGDGTANGLFTLHLRKVWNNGAYRGTYQGFLKAIQRLMSERGIRQQPQYFTIGPSDYEFERQQPFQVAEFRQRLSSRVGVTSDFLPGRSTLHQQSQRAVTEY